MFYEFLLFVFVIGANLASVSFLSYLSWFAFIAYAASSFSYIFFYFSDNWLSDALNSFFYPDTIHWITFYCFIGALVSLVRVFHFVTNRNYIWDFTIPR